jgi:NTE family protein
MGNPDPGRIALCLSGGGFRALHWHLGGLRALNARGWLPRLAEVSGVSGGALVGAWLGLCWERLRFDARGVAVNYAEEVDAPLRALAQLRLGIASSVACFAAVTGWANRLLAEELDRVLFRRARLNALPRQPHFQLCAVCLDTAQPVVLDADGVAHAQHGRAAAPGLSLAAAVAASCAFTPFFAPAVVSVLSRAWERGGPARLLLADGVLQDVTGTAHVWGRCGTLLVSDASLPAKYPTPLYPSWHSVLLHAQRVLFQQSRGARLERLADAMADGTRRGAYWGLGGPLRPGDGDVAEAPELWRVTANFLRLPEGTQRALERSAEARAARALDELDPGATTANDRQ